MTLQEFFIQHRKVALGFSGGVDSSYLLFAAIQNNADILPYYVKTPFQPAFELKDARRLAGELKCGLKVLTLNNLTDVNITKNGADRCYHCKKRIFAAIKNQAAAEGYKVLIDGCQASDDAGDRQGMRATGELEVRSPLRECGISKADVRKLSRDAGLFTWDKPAYACLATRIKTSVPITVELLEKIERSEDFMFSLGYKDFRVRTDGIAARLQVTEEQMSSVFTDREKIYMELRTYFTDVTLDLACRG